MGLRAVLLQLIFYKDALFKENEAHQVVNKNFVYYQDVLFLRHHDMEKFFFVI